jgi:hypothetical protein
LPFPGAESPTRSTTIRTKAITTTKGRAAYESVAEVTIELGAWVDGQFVAWADAVTDGGHISGNEADSIKGSYTNAIKKCCGFFGCGKAAYLVGWKRYFRLAETPRVLSGLDEWIRHRLRLAQLKQWKRGSTVYRELRARGAPERVSRAAAAHASRWWRTAGHGALHTALPTSYYDRRGVPRLAG